MSAKYSIKCNVIFVTIKIQVNAKYRVR